MKSTSAQRQALAKRAGKLAQKFMSGRIGEAEWRAALALEAEKHDDDDEWAFVVDRCFLAAGNIMRSVRGGSEPALKTETETVLTAEEALSALYDEDGKRLQLSADEKARVAEFWQGIYEEGKEEGDRDCAKGVDVHYIRAVAALKIHPEQPYWEGYVKGYEGVMKEN